jgi:hypothetical protein
MRLEIAAGCFAVLASSWVCAQESPAVGKYFGRYQSGAQGTVSIVLDITRIDKGVIRATGSSYSTGASRGCSGVYPIEGTVTDNRVSLSETQRGGPPRTARSD